MSYDYLFKIIFVGDTCVGKTALAERITKNDFTESYNSTIGIDFSATTLDVDQHRIKTHIWDTAGQECFSSIISTYYRGIAGAVIVFDVSRRKSFKQCNFWLNEIKKHGTPDHMPILMLVGNKIDRDHRAISWQEAQKFAQDNNMMYCETSARKDINVKEFYYKLIHKIYHSADLENINEKYGIRRGIAPQSIVRIKKERDCEWSPCCTIL